MILKPLAALLIMSMDTYQATSALKLLSPSVERNKVHILNVLKPLIMKLQEKKPTTQILEIATGTGSYPYSYPYPYSLRFTHFTHTQPIHNPHPPGEHAAQFASSIPNLIYQPTEMMQEMHESIIAWSTDVREFESNSIVHPPKALDVIVGRDELSNFLPSSFLEGKTDAMICINMIHISPFAATDALFSIMDQCIAKDGFMMTYGPYKVNGNMVESNTNFNLSLKSRNPDWGIRDVEEVRQVATKYKIDLFEKVDMPANNLCLIWKRTDLC